ncbi:hypothetical protein ABPG75_012058 [Micractinium tetrahymenae]
MSLRQQLQQHEQQRRYAGAGSGATASLRRRQLHLQYKTSATASGSAKLWRPAQQTQNKPSVLLARRGARPLGLLIPTTYTNVQPTEARVQLIAVLDAPCWRRTGAEAAAPAAPAAAAAASQQLELLLCCSSGELPQAKAARATALLPADVAAEAAAEAVDAVQRSAAAALLQRVQRAASLPSPAKRTRLEGPATAELQRPSHFAPAAAHQVQRAQQQQQVWWVNPQSAVAPNATPFAMQQAQQTQQQQQLAAHQTPWWVQQPAQEPATAAVPAAAHHSLAAWLQGTPECTATGPALLSANGTSSSARASLCLSSRSFASEASGTSTLQSYGCQPLPSATSVLPPLLPSAWAAAASCAHGGAFSAALPGRQQQQQQKEARVPTIWPLEQQAQAQAQAHVPGAQIALHQQHQHQHQQQHQTELYWQRLHAIKAERAYPVVLELAPAQPAIAASEQGVAAALSSLLLLLSKRKAD